MADSDSKIDYSKKLYEFQVCKEAAELIAAYNRDVNSDQDVCALLKILEQNPATEVLHVQESAKKIRKLDIAKLGVSRRAIIGWLTKVAAVSDHLPYSFWFEMSFRCLKLVTISACLERMNLESFSTPEGTVVPQPDDMPQAVTVVLVKAKEFRASKKAAAMKQSYTDVVNSHKDELLL